MWRFHVNKAEKLIGYSIETLSYEYVVVNGTRLRLSKNDEDRRSDRGLFRFVTEQGADVFLIGGSYCYIQNQLTEGKFTAVNDGTVLCRVGDRRQAATLFRITKHNDSTLSFRTTKGTYLMCGHNSLIHGSPVSISGYLKLKTRIGFYRKKYYAVIERSLRSWKDKGRFLDCNDLMLSELVDINIRSVTFGKTTSHLEVLDDKGRAYHFKLPDNETAYKAALWKSAFTKIAFGRSSRRIRGIRSARKNHDVRNNAFSAVLLTHSRSGHRELKTVSTKGSGVEWKGKIVADVSHELKDMILDGVLWIKPATSWEYAIPNLRTRLDGSEILVISYDGEVCHYSLADLKKGIIRSGFQVYERREDRSFQRNLKTTKSPPLAPNAKILNSLTSTRAHPFTPTATPDRKHTTSNLPDTFRSASSPPRRPAANGTLVSSPLEKGVGKSRRMNDSHTSRGLSVKSNHAVPGESVAVLPVSGVSQISPEKTRDVVSFAVDSKLDLDTPLSGINDRWSHGNEEMFGNIVSKIQVAWAVVAQAYVDFSPAGGSPSPALVRLVLLQPGGRSLRKKTGEIEFGEEADKGLAELLLFEKSSSYEPFLAITLQSIVCLAKLGETTSQLLVGTVASSLIFSFKNGSKECERWARFLGLFRGLSVFLSKSHLNTGPTSFPKPSEVSTNTSKKDCFELYLENDGHSILGTLQIDPKNGWASFRGALGTYLYIRLENIVEIRLELVWKCQQGRWSALKISQKLPRSPSNSTISFKTQSPRVAANAKKLLSGHDTAVDPIPGHLTAPSISSKNRNSLSSEKSTSHHNLRRPRQTRKISSALIEVGYTAGQVLKGISFGLLSAQFLLIGWVLVASSSLMPILIRKTILSAHFHLREGLSDLVSLCTSDEELIGHTSSSLSVEYDPTPTPVSSHVHWRLKILEFLTALAVASITGASIIDIVYLPTSSSHESNSPSDLLDSLSHSNTIAAIASIVIIFWMATTALFRDVHQSEPHQSEPEDLLPPQPVQATGPRGRTGSD